MFTNSYEATLLSLTVFTTLIQIYVFYLIRCKSPKNITEYCYFLYIFMTWDMIFSLIMGVGLDACPLSPFLASVPRGACALIGGNACNLMAGFAVFAGSGILTTEVYCITYRFTVLLPNKQIHRVFMSTPSKLFWWAVGLVVDFSSSYLFYKTLAEPETISNHPAFNRNATEVKIYDNEPIILVDIQKPIASVLLWTLTVLLLSGELMCMSLIYAILRYLRRNSKSFSKATYRLHIQLTTLLAIQLFCPLILIYLPVCLYIYIALRASGPNQIANEVGLLLLTLYGMLNAASTIIFVGPYRRHTYECFVVPVWKRMPYQIKKPFLPKQSTVFSMATGFAAKERRISEAARTI